MNALRDIANQAEYGGAALAQESPKAIGRPSNITENLVAQKSQLEAKLARINAALDALKANPNFEEMLNLLSSI